MVGLGCSLLFRRTQWLSSPYAVLHGNNGGNVFVGAYIEQTLGFPLHLTRSIGFTTAVIGPEVGKFIQPGGKRIGNVMPQVQPTRKYGFNAFVNGYNVIRKPGGSLVTNFAIS